MPSYLQFADANASFEEAQVVIFGVPYDRTTSFRGGTRHGPAAIRQASWNFETYLMEHNRDLQDVMFYDKGNTEEFGAPSKMVEGVRSFTAPIVKAGKIPLVLGGEHSLSPGVVKAFPKDTGVIGLDAHLDFRESYLGEKFSHACSARRIADHVGVKHVVYMGIRSQSREETLDAKKLGLKTITSSYVEENGIDDAIQTALKLVARKNVYLTIDVDCIDPAYAPGVGNPEPFGLKPSDVKKVIDTLGPSLVGMDINEVAPQWDGGQTALLAARLAQEAIVVMTGD